MTLFRLPEPPPEEKTICEMDMRYLEHLRADSYKQGQRDALEAAANVCERIWPDKDCSGHEWSDGWADGTSASADAIRKLMEEL